MKKNKLIYILSCFVLLILTSAFIPDNIEKIPVVPGLRVIRNEAFDVGETLTFWLGWQGINGGTAKLSVLEKVKINDRWTYHIKSEAWSNKAVSLFFPVRDEVETFVDVDGIFSWRFEKHLSEGKYKSDKYYDFDQFNHLAISSKHDTLKIPEYVQDILSAFYFVRTQSLTVGKTIYVPNFDNDKNYSVQVRVIKKQKIKVKAGKFNTIKIEPRLESEGLFKKQGRLFIWLTDDERHIPVLMRSKAIVGAFEANLESMKGVK